VPSSAGLLADLSLAAASAAVTAGLAAISMAMSALVSIDGSSGCTSTLQQHTTSGDLSGSTTYRANLMTDEQ